MTPGAAPRAEAIAARLADRIASGEIAPGERLPSEARLVEEFGASRALIREALQRLQTRGLVRSRVGSGSYALTPPAPVGDEDWLAARTPNERSELHAFRIALEAEAAALAARNASDAQLSAIEAAAGAVADAVDPAASVEADFAFHRAVAAASGNRYLLAGLELIGARAIVVPQSRIASTQHDGLDARSALAEHRAVVEAVRSGDPLGAAAAMRTHLTASATRNASTGRS